MKESYRPHCLPHTGRRRSPTVGVTGPVTFATQSDCIGCPGHLFPSGGKCVLGTPECGGGSSPPASCVTTAVPDAAKVASMPKLETLGRLGRESRGELSRYPLRWCHRGDR
eukprot:scaffold111786_cov63-Phaeocystis_antarctica.AAC.5